MGRPMPVHIGDHVFGAAVPAEFPQSLGKLQDGIHLAARGIVRERLLLHNQGALQTLRHEVKRLFAGSRYGCRSCARL